MPFALSNSPFLIRKDKRMKLNIYEKKKIVKTYEADSYDLTFGTVEDVADAIKLDKLKGTDTEILESIGAFVITSKDTVKDLMKDIFDGITDEELRHTKISEQIVVIYDVLMFTVKQLTMFSKAKN